METVVKQTGRIVEATTYDRNNNEVIVEIKLRLPGGDDPKAFLQMFYVVPRVEYGSVKYKGRGKKSLCEVINKLVAEKKLTSETILELDASGGTVADGFTSTESEESLDKFLASYPIALENLRHDVELENRGITLIDKARLAEAIRQNHRLIAYYKTYGFTVVEDKGEYARMTGTIRGILSACQKTIFPLGNWDGKDLFVVIEKDREFTRIEAEVPNPDGGDPLATLEMELPSQREREGGYIELLSVNTRSGEGKNVDKLKGLGKALLCTIFRYLKRVHRLYDWDMITLDAAGGFIENMLLPNPEDSNEKLEETIRKYGDGVLKQTKENYEMIWKPLGKSYRQVLIEAVRDINQTRRLIEYYKGYGFYVVPGGDQGVSAAMKAQVYTIQRVCSPPKKGGKKRRAYSGGYTRRRERAAQAQRKTLRHMRGIRTQSQGSFGR